MANARGLIAREEMKLAEGGSWSATETGSRLGITKAAVLKRYQKGQLIGWRESRQNAVRFPAWQFSDDRPLPGITDVLQVLQIDDWAKIVFFLSQLSSLGGKRPLDLIRAGQIREVLRAAHGTID